MAEIPRPTVILLSLESESVWQDTFKLFFIKLKVGADVQEITNATVASALFSSGLRGPRIFIATDDALTQDKYSQLRKEARDFVQGGGTLIFGIGFPSITTYEGFQTLFDAFALCGHCWKLGECSRGEFEFNRTVEHMGSVALPSKYSQKAVHLRSVESKHALYLPSGSSPTADLIQTPVAFRKYESGWLGYLGDVNMEEESHQVLFGMVTFVWEGYLRQLKSANAE